MSHMLYFSSFSPENFRKYFIPPTKDSLQLLFKVNQSFFDDFDMNRNDLKLLATHLLRHGLTYQGLDEAKAEQLDLLFRHVIFSSFFGNSDEVIFELKERNESDGVRITIFETLLEHAERIPPKSSFCINIAKRLFEILLFSIFRLRTGSFRESLQSVGKPKDYPMIQFCMEGRRYGETTPWGEYESYMIFNDEELIQLRREIRSILERDSPWRLDKWKNAQEFIDFIEKFLLSPIETAIREKRWLIGMWG